MINSAACFCVLLMAVQPLCIQSPFLSAQVRGKTASWAAAAKAFLQGRYIGKIIFESLGHKVNVTLTDI